MSILGSLYLIFRIGVGLILPEISSILFIICNVSYQSNGRFNCYPGCSFWIYKTNKGRDKRLAFLLSFLRMVFNHVIKSCELIM